MAPIRPLVQADPALTPAAQFLAAPPRGWLRLALESGGDERLWRDPHSGRNRYGVPAGPAEDELWFSSSTASAVSPRGHAAAARALECLAGAGASPADLADGVRARLLDIYGAPGAGAVLGASGTELELLALSLARLRAPGPLTNLVIAPGETGSGVALAADGRFFLSSAPFDATVVRGERLTDLETAEIHVQGVAIRTAQGAPRPACDIDAEAEGLAAAALQAGRSVLLHVLDCSKTGLSGVDRAAARRIRALAPDRVTVLVDACQLRCDAAQVRADLADGFAVAITGSKFAAGPAFCGALLTPAGWGEALAGRLRLPSGLAAFSARLDWPAAWREAIVDTLHAPFNLGLVLRWTAALAEIEAYEGVAPADRAAILAAFGEVVANRASRSAHVSLVDQQDAAPSILLLRATALPGVLADAWKRLEAPGPDGPACHLGQPVAVGDGAVLRVCASMPMITEVAGRLARGQTLDQAMSPIRPDIGIVIDRLDRTLALS